MADILSRVRVINLDEHQGKPLRRNNWRFVTFLIILLRYHFIL